MRLYWGGTFCLHVRTDNTTQVCISHNNPIHICTHIRLCVASSSSTSITSCGDFTEGSDFQLTCTVTGVTNSSPMILWFGPPGRPTFSSNGVEVGDIIAMGNTYSRSLRFPSLSPQHAGRYICMNSVTSRPTVEHQLFLAGMYPSPHAVPLLHAGDLGHRSQCSHH